MMQRILALTGFFVRMLFTSLSGIIYVILALAYWYLFFPPQQQTPDFDNYTLIIGGLGAALAFLITLTIAARANEASNYPLVVRLPSKVEYLTAVLLTTLIATTLLQLMVALLALIGGPEITLAQVLDIPPIWIAVNVLSAVLAMHASDFVTTGWSRVYIFGILAVFLFGQNTNDTITNWLAGRASRMSSFFINRQLISLSELTSTLSQWLSNDGTGALQRAFGFIFWPIRAITDAVTGGFFTATQALAPAILLLYATILFMLAADLFANKDLDFTE
jgi:hypothetical protein